MGEELRQHGCKVTLLVSTKGIDQQVVQCIQDLEVIRLSACQRRRENPVGWRFETPLRLNLWKSRRQEEANGFGVSDDGGVTTLSEAVRVDLSCGSCRLR